MYRCLCLCDRCVLTPETSKSSCVPVSATKAPGHSISNSHLLIDESIILFLTHIC